MIQFVKEVFYYGPIVKKFSLVRLGAKGLKGFYCKKHNAGLNMRHKHGNQTITAAQEGQSNTL